ncbi:MAG: glycosyltransferase family 4 protein [Candidatus Thermoplasmatota archaeon]|nr:glycosyltransferase family 4 protein [Candidatus Thermoplasmatota archaeon]
MRIAHVVSYFQPEFGYEEYYSAREQAAMGHEVHVITSDRIFPFKDASRMLADIGSPYKDRKRPLGAQEMEGFTVHRGKTRFEVLFDLISYEGVVEALREIRPDVVHAHGLWQWGTRKAASVKDELGFKLVIDEHAYSTTYDQTKTFRNWLLDKEYRLLRAPHARRSLKKADRLVAICQETVVFLRDFYGIKGCELIELGIDHRKFMRDEASRERVRKELGVGDGHLLITAGRVEREKRLEHFIEAVKLTGLKDIHLLVVGRGDQAYLERLKAISDERTIFMGFKDQRALSALYSASDLGLWGKASITIREAMGCSLPLLLYDVPNMKDLIKWDNGIFVEPSPVAVKEGIMRMLSDPKALRKMGDNGRKGVMEELSVAVEAAKLLDLYKACLKAAK